MAEVNNNSPKRKFGWGSLFMLLIIALVIFGIIRAVLGTGSKTEEVDPATFLNRISADGTTLNADIPYLSINSKSATGDNNGYYVITGKYKKIKVESILILQLYFMLLIIKNY